MTIERTVRVGRNDFWSYFPHTSTKVLDKLLMAELWFYICKIYNNHAFLSLNYGFDWGGSDESICLKAFYTLETWSQIILGDFVCCYCHYANYGSSLLETSDSDKLPLSQ